MNSEDEAQAERFRESVNETFEDVVTLQNGVSNGLCAIEELLQRYSELFAEMQAGRKVKGVELSDRRAATQRAIELVRGLRAVVDKNADAFSQALEKFAESGS